MNKLMVDKSSNQEEHTFFNTTEKGPPKNPRLKRYNMALPFELYEELREVAKEEHTTILDLVRKFIKLGLIALRIERDPDARIIIRDSKGERELQMLI